MKLTVNPQKVALAMRFVSTEKTRPVLHGVLFRAADKAVIATDGRTLLRWRDAHQLDTDVVLMIPKGVRGKLAKAVIATLEYLDTDRWLLTLDEDEAFGCRQQMDAHYPDVDAVIPTNGGAPVERIVINPEYVGRFADVVDQRPVFAFHGASKGVLVTTADPQFTGMVMPMRLGDD